jgi:hypothetical protein
VFPILLRASTPSWHTTARVGGALAVAAALLTAPVVTSATAAPQPVKPALRSTPLGGVDRGALAQAPKAFDPAAVPASKQPPAAQPGRVPDTTTPAVFTTPLSVGPFAVAGVLWTTTGAPAQIVVQVRVHEDGAWTDWLPLNVEGGPDPQTAEAQHAGTTLGTEPLASVRGDAVQVRVDTGSTAVPRDLRLVTVDPGNSPADANPAGTPSASAHGAVLAPSIITRAQWGADESLRPAGCTPTYSQTIKAGIVHHTVNTNTYAASDSAAIVRAIYAYHVDGNGWCDIGYNVLVDRFGQVFEGRYGGVDRPVIGAHAGGFNTDTFGVAAIGDFTTATPADPMLTAMSRVVGWKLGLHGRDPQGTTTLISAGGPYTGYAAGTPVTVGTVSGHRDVDQTDCPGDSLYARLPSLRSSAATYVQLNQAPNEDLYGVLLSGSSGKVEVHGQSLSSSYANRLIDAATALSSADPSQWRFALGSYSGDSGPDLIAVRTAGTASGRVEVHVVSWASSYHQTILDAVTPLSTFTPDDAWQVSTGGPGGGDLYFLALRGTGSGEVEVHVLSASSQYSQWSLHAATTLGASFPSASNRFLIARGSGDLYLVAHGSTGSGRTEVHALSASSGYQAFTIHAVTPLGATSDASATWVLGTGPSPNVLFVPLTGTGTGRVEVHRLSAASAYGIWTLHTATSLPAVAYPGWQFGLG